MRRTIALLLLLACALPLRAEDRPPYAAVIPYLDKQAVGVLHVRPTAKYVGRMLARLGALAGVKEKDLAVRRKEATEWVKRLNDAGVRDIYAVLSLEDVPGGTPLVVVPLEDGGRAKDVIAQLKRLPVLGRLGYEEVKGVVLGGAAGTRKRGKALKAAVAMPETQVALAAMDRTAAGLAYLPTPLLGRVAGEVFPTLPAALGGASARPLTHGVQWAVLGVDLDRRLSVRLTVKAESNAAARGVYDLLAGAYKAARKRDPRLPDLDKLDKALTLNVDGDRLTVTLNEKALTALPVSYREWLSVLTRDGGKGGKRP